MASGEQTEIRPQPSRAAVQTQRLITWLHTRFFRLSGGKIGGRMAGCPVLLLTTKGRKTGKERVTPLLYIPDDENFVLIASNGGVPNHPAWYWNMQSNPEVTVEVGSRKLRVRAEDATGAERERLWAKAVSMYSGYADYQKRTKREIPVVILRQVSG
ncbi:MAG: nitroreductase family deazaflavin-dependent oxidoreductase [Chloroflexi bacterium]|nr:nitroreductase family deazaflavin-dependent oxidoreductase [Chloroflexota bacterium]